MAGIGVSVDGLDDLQATFERAQREIVPQVEKVTGRACRNIQLGGRRRIRGHPTTPHISRTITYDVWSEGLTVFGEVGPDRRRGGQAALAHIIEHGSPTSAPRPFMLPASVAEEPVWRFYVEDAAAKLLED